MLNYLLTPLIIKIDNRPLGEGFVLALHELGKQTKFGMKILFHISVKIEMILSQIGEHHDIKFATRHAI